MASSGRWTVEFKDWDGIFFRTLRPALFDFKSRPEKTGEAAAAAAMMDISLSGRKMVSHLLSVVRERVHVDGYCVLCGQVCV